MEQSRSLCNPSGQTGVTILQPRAKVGAVVAAEGAGKPRAGPHPVGNRCSEVIPVGMYASWLICNLSLQKRGRRVSSDLFSRLLGREGTDVAPDTKKYTTSPYRCQKREQRYTAGRPCWATQPSRDSLSPIP